MSVTVHVDREYEGTILNDGFYPDIDVPEFQKTYREDGRLDEEVIRDQLITAILEVNDDLIKWKALKLACENTLKPIESLADTSEQTIDGKNRAEIIYKKAIYHRAKAELLRHFTDYSTTQHGQDRADDKTDNANYHYAQSLRAIRQLKGKRGVRVKLVKGSLNDFI